MVQRDERLSQFISDRLPEIGASVQVLCEDHVGTYVLPFLCRRTESGWSNAGTSQMVDADVLGWRLPADAKARRSP